MLDTYLLVMTSCPDDATARTIAHDVVDAKLAACAQISAPMTSVYRWQGKVCQESEVSLSFKCHQSLYPQLAEKIIALHPYDVPELIATEIVQGSPAYLDWIKETTQL